MAAKREMHNEKKNEYVNSGKQKALSKTAEKQAVYEQAILLMKKDEVAAYREAIGLFESIAGWKSADMKIDQCRQKIKQIEDYREQNVIDKMLQEKKQSKRREHLRDAKKLLAYVSVLVAVVLLFKFVLIPRKLYKDANELLQRKLFFDARDVFERLGDYKDSEEKLALCIQEIKGWEDYYDELEYR